VSVVDKALYYKNTLGISVVPQRNKAPLVPWAEFQARMPSDEEIRHWWTKYPDAGIMGVVGSISGVVVIDCDSIEAINSFENSLPEGVFVPCSQTPRGGRHYYFASADKLQKQVGFKDKTDFQAEGSGIVMPPSVGANGKAYEWLIEPVERADFPSLSILPFHSSFLPFNAPKPKPTVKPNEEVIELFSDGRRDNDLFHTANCLAKGHMPDAEIEQVLLAIMQSWGECDIKWAMTKVRSAMDRTERKERNFVQEVSEWVDLTTGNFMSGEVVRALNIFDKNERNHIHVILRRMWEKGAIEKTGIRNGSWRKVESTCEILDWRNVESNEYQVEFPLGISHLIKLYPGSIACLAGASNTGKSSFCFETIRLNQKKFPVYYFSSEGGAEELRLRLSSYPLDMVRPEEWVFTAKERSSNFADVIVKDAFNIVDFMEIYDEFYQIGGWIRDISNKLGKGFCLICIQKNQSTKKEQRDFGRGGEMTIEKPRLYMAMDRGKIKIVKGKIWRSSDTNPNGLMRNFKLIGGWKWLPDGDWYRENEDKDFPRER